MTALISNAAIFAAQNLQKIVVSAAAASGYEYATGAGIGSSVAPTRNSGLYATIDYAQSVTAAFIALSILGTGGAGCAAFALFAGAHGAVKLARFSQISSGNPPLPGSTVEAADKALGKLAAIVNIAGGVHSLMATSITHSYHVFNAIVLASLTLTASYKIHREGGLGGLFN